VDFVNEGIPFPLQFPTHTGIVDFGIMVFYFYEANHTENLPDSILLISTKIIQNLIDDIKQ
jgi:hypothetical protein